MRDNEELEGESAWGRLQTEDASLWGRLLEADSMSMSELCTPPGDCVRDFATLKCLVKSSKHAQQKIEVCPGRVAFNSPIDMTDAKFIMTCPQGSCEFDGWYKTFFFKAGGGHSAANAQSGLAKDPSEHNATFDNIDFVRGSHMFVSTVAATMLISSHSFLQVLMFSMMLYPQAGAQGGAFELFGGAINLNECEFVDNLASDGGAFYLADGIAFISKCRFEANTCEDAGCAIKMEGNLGLLRVSIRDTKFIGNVRDEDLQGVYIQSSDIYEAGGEFADVDCGAGSGNQFCDADPTLAPIVSTARVCTGAQIGC